MEPVIIREEHIEKFPALSLLLGKVTAAVTPEVRQEFSNLVSAECIQCAMAINGEELLLIADKSVEQPGSKVQRLRQGYCARQGCNSYFYRIKFFAHPALNWQKALIEAEMPVRSVPSDAVNEVDAATIAKRAARREYWVRGSIALALLGLVLIARHWYRGGAIPIVRAPEKFKVGIQTTNEVRQKFVE